MSTDFSLRLKGLREDYELSQSELAKNLGVGTGSIGMWESTNRIPPSKKLIEIAKYFHCTTDYLLGFSNDKYPITSALSSDEQELLECYRLLSDKYKNVALDTMRGLAGQKQIIIRGKNTTKKN